MKDRHRTIRMVVGNEEPVDAAEFRSKIGKGTAAVSINSVLESGELERDRAKDRSGGFVLNWCLYPFLGCLLLSMIVWIDLMRSPC